MELFFELKGWWKFVSRIFKRFRRKAMNPIHILSQEHSLIRQVLDHLTAAKEKLETAKWPPGIFFEKAVEFSANFSDKYHHFKEEYVMFGLLAQKKEGAFDVPIGVLRYEHERCRSFISIIQASIEGYNKRDEIATTTLLENLAPYISILKRHIHKEEHIFFPMVQGELSHEENQTLLRHFEKEEKRIGNKDIMGTMHKLVLEMKFLLDE